MTTDIAFSGKRACLLGLGTSSLALLDFLLARGARVTVRDRRAPDALPLSEAELKTRGVRLICGEEHLLDID